MPGLKVPTPTRRVVVVACRPRYQRATNACVVLPLHSIHINATSSTVLFVIPEPLSIFQTPVPTTDEPLATRSQLAPSQSGFCGAVWVAISNHLYQFPCHVSQLYIKVGKSSRPELFNNGTHLTGDVLKLSSPGRAAPTPTETKKSDITAKKGCRCDMTILQVALLALMPITHSLRLSRPRPPPLSSQTHHHRLNCNRSIYFRVFDGTRIKAL